MTLHWKNRGRLFGISLLAISFVNANAGYSAGPAVAASGDPVIDYSTSDSAMNLAQAEARQHLERFFSHVIADDGLAREDAAVKIALPTDGQDVEVIWVTPFGRAETGFVGVLANAPVRVDGLELGDVVRFDEHQVRDWYYFGRDGQMYGSFTTRVMLSDMSPTAAAQVSGILSETPLPAGW